MWFQNPSVRIMPREQVHTSVAERLVIEEQRRAEAEKALETCKKALKAKELEGDEKLKKLLAGKEAELQEEQDEKLKFQEELEKRELEGGKCDEKLKKLIDVDDFLQQKAKELREMEASATFIKSKGWFNPYRMMNVAGRTDVKFWKQLWYIYKDLGGNQREDGTFSNLWKYAGYPPSYWKDPANAKKAGVN